MFSRLRRAVINTGGIVTENHNICSFKNKWHDIQLSIEFFTSVDYVPKNELLEFHWNFRYLMKLLTNMATVNTLQIVPSVTKLNTNSQSSSFVWWYKKQIQNINFVILPHRRARKLEDFWTNPWKERFQSLFLAFKNVYYLNLIFSV